MVGLYIGLGVLAALVAIFFVLGYIKAPPDTAFIVSGLGKDVSLSVRQAGECHSSHVLIGFLLE